MNLTAVQLVLLIALASPPVVVEAFSPTTFSKGVANARLHSTNRLHMSSESHVQTNVFSLELEKPLGIILEEMEEGQAKGVKVKELADSGSAWEYKDKLVGLKLARVMEQDVTAQTFDEIMKQIIEAPSPITIDFEIEKDADSPITTISEPLYEAGTTVTIHVLQEGKPEMAIEAKVGDNLRQVLLENNVEVYRGLKKKLGNCGGAGQCTFCAVDFVASQGWQPRSEYEDGKIAKWPKARLACLNNIQGPATIRVQ